MQNIQDQQFNILLSAISDLKIELVAKIDNNHRELTSEILQNREAIYENTARIDKLEERSDITELKLEAIAQLQNKHAVYHEEHSKRFDQIDKKLEEHDARFDEVDKRLEEHDRRFDRLEEMIITNEANRQEDTKEIKMLLGNHNARIENLELNLSK